MEDKPLFENRKIAFIGPGAMAEAMISGLIRTHVAKAEVLMAAGPGPERLRYLHEKYTVHTYTDNAEAARQADLVVLSVKPQRLDRVLAGLKGSIPPTALV